MNDGTEQRRLIEAALEWLRRGYNVVPQAVDGSKHPAVKWKEFQQEKVTVQDLSHWAHLFTRGLGFITGEISGVIIIESDGEEGETLLREFESEYCELPETLIVRSGSGRGYHYHFKHPGHHVRTAANPSIKLDVKGDGGFAVLPPSLHKSGGRYEIVHEAEPAELPDGLLDFIDEKAGKQRSQLPIETLYDPAGLEEFAYDGPPTPSEEMHDMLEAIKPTGRFNDYEDWCRTGMALRAAYGDDVGFKLWALTFYEGQTQDDAWAKWGSFTENYRGKRVTIGTIWHWFNELERPKIAKVEELPVEQKAITLPDGYAFATGGGIITKVAVKKGEPIETQIMDYDLWAVEHSSMEGCYFSRWAVRLPVEGVIEFDLDNTVMQDPRLLIKDLMRNKIVVDPEYIDLVRKYMNAYIKSLQEYTEAKRIYNHLGWDAKPEDVEPKGFILPSIYMSKDGPKHVSMTTDASNTGRSIRTAGTFEDQVRALSFFNHPSYAAHQLLIACSLGSVLLRMTNFNGAIVHVVGDTGSFKSTALVAAASLWGAPSQYILDGNEGITANSARRNLAILSSLPNLIDEVTRMGDKEVYAWVMSSTQAQADKKRLNRDGSMAIGIEAEKNALQLSTGNKSIHEILGSNGIGGEAGIVRVLELLCDNPQVHNDAASKRFHQQIAQNFGFIGPMFADHVVMHYAEIMENISNRIEQLSTMQVFSGTRRFYPAVLACALESFAICERFGWLPFKTKMLQEYIESDLASNLAVSLGLQVLEPYEILNDFLRVSNRYTVTMATRIDKTMVALKETSDDPRVRHETTGNKIIISSSAFQEYCSDHGYSALNLRRKLTADGIIIDNQSRHALGAGIATMSAARVRTFVVDGAHEKVIGPKVEETNVIPLAERGRLR